MDGRRQKPNVFIMPQWVGHEVPTLVTDGDSVRFAGVLPRSWTRSAGTDGYPIWRPDHPSGFESGVYLRFEFGHARAYVIVQDRRDARRELWFRGDA